MQLASRAVADLDLREDRRRRRRGRISVSTRSAAGVTCMVASGELRNSEMISTDSTPTTAPRPSTTGPYWVSERSRSDSASRSTSSSSRIGSGEVSGLSGTVSRAMSRSDIQPSGRPSASTTSGIGQVRFGDRRARLRGRLADAHERRLPQVDVAHAQQREPLQRPVGPDEVLDELVRRGHQQLLRRRVLGEDPALAQDRHPVAHLDRLVDVVGDEQDRLADLRLEAQELVLQALAVDRVDRAERLVHQHQRRIGRERARDADALALAAGQLRRVAVAQLGRRATSARAARRPVARTCFLSQPSSFGTTATFSPIVRCGNRPICWIT